MICSTTSTSFNCGRSPVHSDAGPAVRTEQQRFGPTRIARCLMRGRQWLILEGVCEFWRISGNSRSLAGSRQTNTKFVTRDFTRSVAVNGEKLVRGPGIAPGADEERSPHWSSAEALSAQPPTEKLPGTISTHQSTLQLPQLIWPEGGGTKSPWRPL